MATDINLLTGVLRAEFLNSLPNVAKPAPFSNITTVINSTVRMENYGYMTPTPGLAPYKGYRRLGTISSKTYSILNIPYDASFVVPLRDLKDDQVGGYKRRMGDLMKKAGTPFQSRLALQKLAAGKTTTCFDDSYFFATTHNMGGYATNIPGTTTNTGGNLLNINTAAIADGLTHRMVVCVKNDFLNPIVYQVRDNPKFMTDAGTPQSELADKAIYAVQLEAAAGYGYWWDAVMVEFAGTPTFTETLTGLDVAKQALRRFTYPISQATDPVEYPHEQTEWNPETITVVNSVGIENQLTKVLGENSYGISPAGSTAGFQTNNIYYKKFTQITTNALN